MLRIYTVDISCPPERKLKLTHRTEINLEGAVWRTLWLPDLNKPQNDQQNGDMNVKDYKIAVAAARNGIHLLNLSRPTWYELVLN